MAQRREMGGDGMAENAVVKKITFSRDMKDSDFRDMREMFGHKIVQEGT